MENIGAYLESLATTLSATPQESLQSIEHSLWETYERDGAIIICGNGGSAATASHFACDLSKWTICEDRPRVRAIALTDNIPVMLAWANDTHYERVFVEQLMNVYRTGDTLVAISGSGNSPNVLRAVEWANEQGINTISLTGFGGGQLAKITHAGVVVPSHFMPEVEDVHMAICHALAVSIGKRIQQHTFS